MLVSFINCVITPYPLHCAVLVSLDTVIKAHYLNYILLFKNCQKFKVINCGDKQTGIFTVLQHAIFKNFLKNQKGFVS